MKHLNNKNITILLLSLFIQTSCATQKTFNGTAKLDCPDYNGTKAESSKKTKKNTKWKLVLYKDGERVLDSNVLGDENSITSKEKRGKSRLFKNKK
tara:strand:+ start:226 stop:513 length:288 start_codon:yes stop_codon:yes gene_type:complete